MGLAFLQNMAINFILYVHIYVCVCVFALHDRPHGFHIIPLLSQYGIAVHQAKPCNPFFFSPEI